MPGAPKLSVDECQVIDFYATELFKVAKSLTPADHQLALKLF
jgi:hypothetical protein